MKKEALALARRLLKAPTVTGPVLADAANAILTLADKVKPWKSLIESAYQRVPKQKRGSVRFWIMAIRDACNDHAGVLQLAPKRFTGEYALLELLWVIVATFETNNKDLMRRFAVRLPLAIHQAKHPVTQAMLCRCLAEFCAREGEWDDAIAVAESAQENPCFLQPAVGTLVEIHVARALRAVERGFQYIEAFRKDFDPETELVITGVEKDILDDAAKEFRRLQKMLGRVVPKKRQKELGFS